MKIATLGNAAVVHTQRWVEYFRARGHQVALWSLEPAPPGLDARPLPTSALPPLIRYPLATPALRRELDAFAPDLVDAHYVPNYGLLGVLAGHRPLAVSAWGSDLLVTGRGPWRRARARFVLERADLVLTDAENLAAAARALGAPAKRVLCIPWGIAIDHFVPSAERQPGLLLSTRMMEPVYDLATVIEGVAPVLERWPRAELVMAGDGSQRAALEERAARRLPSGRFRFVGRLDATAMAAWLGRADLYLSASLSDSTSLSLLEAMASGAVPVVTDIEGNREWVRDREGARLFAPGDPMALTRALEAVIEDEPWKERVRPHNRAVVELRADRARNMGEIERHFQALASGAP
jgi:glycosyltransferase involved in cell wall biosynthesis